MAEIISRAEAKARGLKRYFTGKPCKHGHVAERFTANRACLQCSRLLKATPHRRARARIAAMAYYYRHHERVLAQVRCRERVYRTRPRNKETVRARQRKWREDNREYYRARGRKWRASNQDKVRRYYLEGRLNPKGELQWLRRNQALLRTVKRLLKERKFPLVAGQSPN